MAGHNKWSKIKHKKAAADAKKSKEFSKLVRLIKAEAKAADGDESSPGLKAAIDQAKAVNMPKDNIKRAIKSATEDPSGGAERVLYEAYGPGGVAILIDILTDNRNRTSSEIKHLLSTFDLELASPGAATWAFEKTDNGWEPKTMSPASAEEQKTLTSVVEALEDHEDVEQVYTNVQS